MSVKLRAPILLVPGLLGYNRLGVGRWTLGNYFPGIPEFLKRSGNRVFVVRLSPTAAVADRAAELQAALRQLAPAEPVHLLAHSMGGLDARYMISRLGMADRVLTLTTIGTPHRGTALADWGVRWFEGMLRPVFQLFSVPRDAFYDLTTPRCREFNEQVPDSPGVRYFSVVGRCEGEGVKPQWRLCHQIVLREEGPNDGVVSIASATYGEEAAIWPGDHLSLVNWPQSWPRGTYPVDRLADYGKIVQRLRDEGY
jgi:triacylglycerol lipase